MNGREWALAVADGEFDELGEFGEIGDAVDAFARLRGGDVASDDLRSGEFLGLEEADGVGTMDEECGLHASCKALGAGKTGMGAEAVDDAASTEEDDGGAGVGSAWSSDEELGPLGGIGEVQERALDVEEVACALIEGAELRGGHGLVGATEVLEEPVILAPEEQDEPLETAAIDGRSDGSATGCGTMLLLVTDTVLVTRGREDVATVAEAEDAPGDLKSPTELFGVEEGPEADHGGVGEATRDLEDGERLGVVDVEIDGLADGFATDELVKTEAADEVEFEELGLDDGTCDDPGELGDPVEGVGGGGTAARDGIGLGGIEPGTELGRDGGAEVGAAPDEFDGIGTSAALEEVDARGMGKLGEEAGRR